MTESPSVTVPQAKGGITQLIGRANGGDIAARDELVRTLYPKLRAIARRRLSAHRTMSLLNATGLLHEALARLLGQGLTNIKDSRHLVSYVAKAMRNVIVDYARERLTQKRDGERTSLTGLQLSDKNRVVDLLALEEGLTRLSLVDERLTTIVEMRCFCGLNVVEIAEQLGISTRTVKRDWQQACAFMKHFVEPISP
jgi:RNA polymerase sigma factor (TIGR02999 family)